MTLILKVQFLKRGNFKSIQIKRRNQNVDQESKRLF